MESRLSRAANPDRNGDVQAGAQQTCAYSNVQTFATTESSCPLGTGGSGVPFTATFSGFYFCPVRVDGSVVSQAHLFNQSVSASGYCNYVGGRWPPYVTIQNCLSGSTASKWCNAAVVQDMGAAWLDPLFPWPKDYREIAVMECVPYCIAGTCQ